LIAHWPKGIEARGELRTRVGHVVDIAPTVVELAGGTWPTEYEGSRIPASPGESLLKSFTDKNVQREGPLWWLHEGNRALRDGQWKVVAAKDEPWQLYDLKSDRSETHDLASEQPETLERLVAEWQKITARIAGELQQTAQK
jgi:arylsulfatase